MYIVSSLIVCVYVFHFVVIKKLLKHAVFTAGISLTWFKKQKAWEGTQNSPPTLDDGTSVPLIAQAKASASVLASFLPPTFRTSGNDVGSTFEKYPLSYLHCCHWSPWRILVPTLTPPVIFLNRKLSNVDTLPLRTLQQLPYHWQWKPVFPVISALPVSLLK